MSYSDVLEISPSLYELCKSSSPYDEDDPFTIEIEDEDGAPEFADLGGPNFENTTDFYNFSTGDLY